MAQSSEQYRKEAGARCPVCGSSEIRGHGFDVDLGVASQTVSCETCDSAWKDQYDLIGYSNLVENK
jgi:hypothetical protein